MRFYTPNTFAVPTVGSGPFLFNAGVVGRPMANGGLAYYERAQFAVPTTGLSMRPVRGMGQTEIGGVEIDPTLLAAGAGVLLLVMYLFGSGRPKRRARRLRKSISRRQAQLRELAV